MKTTRSATHLRLVVSLDGFVAGDGGDLSRLSTGAGEPTAETGYDDLM
jgi:hypothetical protein